MKASSFVYGRYSNAQLRRGKLGMGSSVLPASCSGCLFAALCQRRASELQHRCGLQQGRRKGRRRQLRTVACLKAAPRRGTGRFELPVAASILTTLRSRQQEAAGDTSPSHPASSSWVVAVVLSFLLWQPPACEAMLGPFLFENLAVASSQGSIQWYDPVSAAEKEESDKFSARVSEAVGLLERGKQAQAEGDFSEALRCFNQITSQAGDLALAEYARVGRAIALYEVGDRGEAILEMEDTSISLRGYPEVHAALAAALYSDKHAVIPAEQQFTLATLMDPRYTDPSWVQHNKHWPPSLVASLRRFISFQ